MGLLGKTLGATKPNTRQEGAKIALITLSAINLLNFADRYVPSAVKPLMQEELGLKDTETTIPTTASIFVYMLCALIFGYLADLQVMDRRFLLASGVVLWSLATMLAGFAQGIGSLILTRSLVGVGEAAYMTIVPPMIADFYPRCDRNAAYAVFNLTMPLGGALGFALAAILASTINWRAAFYIFGGPGIIVSLLILRLPDPPRGINDTRLAETEMGAGSTGGSPSATGPGDGSIDETRLLSNGTVDQPSESLSVSVKALCSNGRYLAATVGLIAQSFVIGALAEWYPTLVDRKGVADLATAGIILGLATAIGGIGGTLLGAHVAAHYDGRVKSAFFLVPAVFSIPACIFALMAVGLVTISPPIAFTSIILAETCTFTATAPINAVSVSVVPVGLRARSSGLQIFLLHILGDMIGVLIVGRVSDLYMDQIGNAASLQIALLGACCVLPLSGLAWFYAARCLDPLPCLSKHDGEEAESAGLRELFWSGPEDHQN